MYTQKFLHREIFIQRSFHTQKLLHREALHREVFTPRSFYTQKLLHTEAFTLRSLYAEALLQEVESWNWQLLFRKNTSQKLSGTSLPHLLQEKTSDFQQSSNSMIPCICSKKQKEYMSEAGPHSIAFKPTLRWNRGSSNPAEPTMSVSSKINCCINFVVCDITINNKLTIQLIMVQLWMSMIYGFVDVDH